MHPESSDTLRLVPRTPGDYLTPGGTLIEGGAADGSDRGLSLGQLDGETIRDRLARYDAAQAGIDASEREFAHDELAAGRAPILCVAPGALIPHGGRPSAATRGTGRVVRVTDPGEMPGVQAIARRAHGEAFAHGSVGTISPALRRIQPRAERGTTHRVTRVANPRGRRRRDDGGEL